MMNCNDYIKFCQQELKKIENARETLLSHTRALELAELENFYMAELEDSLDWLSQSDD